jgi:hypothetical protein
MVLGEPYAGGVAPQTAIGGRYAALQTSHVRVNFAELRQRWIFYRNLEFGIAAENCLLFRF